MEKIRKISGIILKVLNILWIVQIVICVIAAVSAAAMLSVPEKLAFVPRLNIDMLSLEFAEGVKMRNPQLYFGMLLVFVIVVLAVTGYILHLLKKIFRPMAAGLPFEESISGYIRKFAWVNLVGGMLISALLTVIKVIQFQNFDLAILLKNSSITSVNCNLNLQLDLNVIVTFAVLYLLSYVFKYGEELQKLSDETL